MNNADALYLSQVSSYNNPTPWRRCGSTVLDLALALFFSGRLMSERENPLFLASQQPICRYFQYIGESVQFDVRGRTFLPFQQGQRRYTHIHAGQLKPRQQFHLLHATADARFGHARADDVLFAQRKFPDLQNTISPTNKLYGEMVLQYLVIPNIINLATQNLVRGESC